jgi:dTDP-glucose 4,6-dehydratase
MKNRYALINMIHDGIYGDYIRVRSSVVSVTRSYMYAADMAIWLWCILLDGEPGGVYEVGATKPVTMWQLAREVQECITPRMMIYHEPMMTREPRPYYVPTTANETMALLGLEEYTPFGEAIAKTVRWYQEEGRELG